jgi:uncharacterized protein (TIGR03083 family)
VDETTAFLETLARHDPSDPTACRGWRVRDLVAHLAAGSQEEAELVEAELRGEPSRPTRSFGEREQVLRDVPYPELLEALAHQGGRLAAATRALIATGGSVEFTGTRLTGRQLLVHTRSELALHRWDLAGNDPVSRTLLAQDDLTDHAVTVLTGMRGLQESVAARCTRRTGTLALRLRAPGTDDVRLVLGPDPSLDRAPAVDVEPVIVTTAADRLLLLWGRRPEGALDMSALPADQHDVVRAALVL